MPALTKTLPVQLTARHFPRGHKFGVAMLGGQFHTFRLFSELKSFVLGHPETKKRKLELDMEFGELNTENLTLNLVKGSCVLVFEQGVDNFPYMELSGCASLYIEMFCYDGISAENADEGAVLNSLLVARLAAKKSKRR